jgi:branched-chain amino acid transport system substrate-binding protein
MRKCVFTTAITILCLFVGFGMASAADTFKIGGLVPVTGTQAVMAEDLATGLKLAEEEVNAAGGVLGKPIKVIIEDTETRPAPGMDAALFLPAVSPVVYPYPSLSFVKAKGFFMLLPFLLLRSSLMSATTCL